MKAPEEGEVRKTIYIRSDGDQRLTREEAQRVLEGVFPLFKSLAAPAATVIAREMIAVVFNADLSALGRMVEALDSVQEVDDISELATFKFVWYGVTLIVPSGTRIKLRSRTRGWYTLRVDFGAKGSTERARQVRATFIAARVDHREAVVGEDGKVSELPWWESQVAAEAADR